MNIGTNETAKKKIWIYLLVLISVFCIIFFAAQGKFSIPLTNRVVVTLLAPFQSCASVVGNKSGNFFDTISQWRTLYQDNKKLKEQNRQLREENSHDAELASENEQLRALLDYKKATPQFNFIAARVIARNPATWINNIVINRGSDDGIKENMPVITPKGLVGYVAKTYGGYSIVEMIIDPRVVVGAMVQRPQSRVAGVIKGNPDGQMKVRMVNIPRTADVQKGDHIVTSGLGGIYPQGINIGQVVDVQNDVGGLLKYAIVEPDVDFSKLENVAVITTAPKLSPQLLMQQTKQVADGSAKEESGGLSK